MAIEDKDIVKIDATVIAGALIFLSILSATTSDPLAMSFSYGESFGNTTISYIGLALASIFIVPFAFSAILATAGRIVPAKISMALGFAILAILLPILTVATLVLFGEP